MLAQQRLLGGSILHLPVGAGRRRHRHPLLGQLRPFAGLGPVGIVAQEMSLKRGLQQGVKSLDVVTVARKLLDKGDIAARGECQVLAYALKPAFERGAIAASDQAAEALLAAGFYGTTDVDGMRIDDEKGGVSSPSKAQKAWVSCCIRGVNSARRSAQLGRERRRGKSVRMTGLDSNHW